MDSNDGNVTECYSIILLSNHGWPFSGLVGSGSGNVTDSFWDFQTSGLPAPIFSAGGTGLTTAEIQTAGTFLDAGWDFVEETDNGNEYIWWILEGQDYPRLWWEIGDEASP